MLNLVLYVWILSHIFSILYVDIESSSAISFLSELDLVIIFIMGAVSKQDFYNLDEEFSDTVDELMRGLQMLLQLDPTIFDNIVIEHQFALDWIIRHKLLTSLQVLNVLFVVIQ